MQRPCSRNVCLATVRIATVIALGFSIAGCEGEQKDSRQTPSPEKPAQQSNSAPAPAPHASNSNPAHAPVADLNNSPLPQNGSRPSQPQISNAAPIGRGGQYAIPVLITPGVVRDSGTSPDQGNTGQRSSAFTATTPPTRNQFDILSAGVPAFVEQTMRTFAQRFPDSMMTSNDTRTATTSSGVPRIAPVSDIVTSNPDARSVGNKVRGAPGPEIGVGIGGLPLVALGYGVYLWRRRCAPTRMG
jgi:hypothetical protein